MISRKLFFALFIDVAASASAQSPPVWTYSIQNGTSVANFEGKVLIGGGIQTIRNVGGASLGRPATGYHWNWNEAANFSSIVSTSGWNQSLSNNDGRTAITNNVAIVENNGNGDAGAFYGNCHINGLGNRGATHWLAEPACVILNGDLATTTPHSYLNQFEFNLGDNGNDVAAIGMVENFNRTNNTAAFGEVWMGDRWQSIGTKALTVGWSGQGLINVGLDTVQAAADSGWNNGNTVAVNMAADQRIEFNSKATPLNGVEYYGNRLGDAYDSFNSAAGVLSRCVGTTCVNVGARIITFASAAIQLPRSTVASLPTCNARSEGELAGVIDADSTVFNAVLTGGGSNHVMAYCNGATWTVH